MPLVDSFNVAKNHALFAALQIVGFGYITFGIQHFG